MAQRVLVSVDGAAGTPGNQFYDARDRVARPGCAGEGGRSAYPPSAGGPAGSVSLEITPAKLESNGIHAEGTAEWAGKRWELAADKNLFVSARGGAGGAGGRGEDGQNGGYGMRGQDATEYADATNGETGADGGDAGSGSHGGEGGPGGVVMLEVSEHDTNLLLAVDWDVSGGRGGDVGAHGVPGEGGLGGEGGNGFTWQVHAGVGYACCGGGRVCTCQKYNQVALYHTYNRPAGGQGLQGYHGNPPLVALSPGAAGPPGAVQIKVKSSNGMESVYPGKYHVKVVSFEVVDENGDGIMEPGEHIIVRNICVQNTGVMPTPAHSRIPVLIKAGSWLEPMTDEPAYLPNSIFPGETVSVRGEVRAFIRQEGMRRYPGVMFSVTEELQLVAVMPGTNRVLPDFFEPTTITIQYPLTLEAPSTLRSVERGSNVTFSWRLWNISSKPYGLHGLLRRTAGTCLSETGDGQMFTFLGPDPARGLDMLDALAPGASATISQTFRASDRADQYSTGGFTLELLLSEPTDSERRSSTLATAHRPLRSVMQYSISVQISAKYSFNADAGFLLAVNADTSPAAIQQTFRLVRDLDMAMDVWNLSVYGNFTNPLTGRNVLFDYAGKSVIIFGNPFDYFGLGVRSAFALLDPFALSYLAAADTQLLFPECSPADAFLAPWFTSLLHPTYAAAASTAVDIDRKILVPTLNCMQRTGALSTHTFTMKPQLLKANKTVLTAESKLLAKKLNEYLPLQRYTFSPSVHTAKKSPTAGTCVVRQGLPRTARVVATFGRWDVASADRLSDFNIYTIIAALPFKTRARLFWAKVGGELLAPAGTQPQPPLARSASHRKSIAPVGVIELDSGAVSKAAARKSIIAMPTAPSLTHAEMDHKIFHALCLSITYELELEFTRFFTSAPWPDPIPENNTFFQLQKADSFFHVTSPTPHASLPPEFELMVETLGLIVAAVQPIGAGQFIGQKMIRYGNRRTHIRVQLLERLDGALKATYSDKIASKLKRKLMRACDKARDEMAQKTIARVILARIGQFTGVEYAAVPWVDAGAMGGDSEVWEEGEEDKRVAAHAEVVGRIAGDEAGSRAMLSEMLGM